MALKETVTHLQNQLQYMSDDDLKRDIYLFIERIEAGEKDLALAQSRELMARTSDSYWLQSAIIDVREHLAGHRC